MSSSSETLGLLPARRPTLMAFLAGIRPLIWSRISLGVGLLVRWPVLRGTVGLLIDDLGDSAAVEGPGFEVWGAMFPGVALEGALGLGCLGVDDDVGVAPDGVGGSGCPVEPLGYNGGAMSREKICLSLTGAG
ncbi:hypothetical protein JB92DRAFT_2826568 [Gautieria morchelliformis]|nr:hypothetical protein JB92DRAFT_2826568 [Gautieria morchelliformis]